MAEVWKDIQGYDSYQVSSDGSVRNILTGRTLKPYERKGYHLVYLYNSGRRKCFLLHRVVALAFIPNPNCYPEINHKDENPLNNCVENLEWCTPEYNCNYGGHNEKIRNANSGVKNHFYGKKHNDDARRKMRDAKLGKPSKRMKPVVVNGVEYCSMSECANALGVSTSHIHNIMNGKRKNINLIIG